MKENELTEKILFIFTNEFCQEIVRRMDFDDVCEGDCDYCHYTHVLKLLNEVDNG